MDPSILLADDSAFENPMEIPEAPGSHYPVYRAAVGKRRFNLHSYLCRFEESFWACWSSGWEDEEGPGQCVVYSRSKDCRSWSPPDTLAEPHSNKDGSPGVCISRGIFVLDGRLTALVAMLDRLIPGRGWEGLRLHRYVWDGSAWESTGVLIDNAINNYPPRRVQNRLFMTVRVSMREKGHRPSVGLRIRG